MTSAASPVPSIPASHGPGGHRGTPPGWTLPQADASTADFGGYAFARVGEAPARPGLFVVTKRIGAKLYPVYAGEAEDVAAALAAFRAEHPQEAGLCDGVFVLERPIARMRAHMLRDIVGRFDPPLNVADRKAPAAPEIAALVADRAEGLDGAGERPGADLDVTEDDLMRLVTEFYAGAASDPLLGPVFARAIPDWESHYQIVQNFWSRTLLGTTRYSGMPFAAHVPLQLRPEHFERWVSLFKETASRVLEPVAAARAIAKVEHMSTCFQAGLFPPAIGTPDGHPHGS